MAYKDARTVCGPWATVDDLCCTDETLVDCETDIETPATYKWTDVQLLRAASNILYARTCYDFPGRCSRTIYPCLNCHCGCSPCGCGTYHAIDLQDEFPVLEISEVSIDGVAVDPAAYRLDDWRYLVRVDGAEWPTCNTLDLPDTTGALAATLFVEYEFGIDPPVELVIAAAELACQLKRACEGQSCALPGTTRDRIKRLSRRGSTIELESITELLKNGLVGNDLIDQALAVHGDCSRTTIIDPARRRRSVQVNTVG